MEAGIALEYRLACCEASQVHPDAGGRRRTGHSKRIADRTRVSRIVQPPGQPVDEAAALHQLPTSPVSALSNWGGSEAEGSVE